MVKNNNSKISESNLLKIILILKIINNYYSSWKKLSSKTIENSKAKHKDKCKNIIDETNQAVLYENNVNREKHKKYKVSKTPVKLEIRNNKVHVNSNKNKHNYLNRDLKKLQLEVPVIVSEKIVVIPLEHHIEFKDYIFNVKGIKNYVYITSSRVLPLTLDNKKMDLKGRIFIEGVIKSTMEYNDVDDISNDSLSGYIRHKTSFIPFKCTTLVSYSHLPIINHNNTTNAISCSLKQAEVFISNNYSNFKETNNDYLEKMFKTINQKIVLRITISLEQIQRVIINKK